MMGQAPPPPTPAPPPLAMAPNERPMGVTVLAVLYFIQGIIIMMTPIMVGLILASILGGILDLDALAGTMICWIPFVLIGLFYFLIGFGLLKGKRWARTLAIVFAIIGLFALPIGTIISIIILVYLFKADVKAYFGK